MSSSDTSRLKVRPAGTPDEAAWRELWVGYLSFYQQSLAPEVTDWLWGRLTDPGERSVIGRVAELDGKVVGLLHAVIHANTWSMRPVCYLEDLYVGANMRCRGVGAALIETLAGEGWRQGWRRIYWRTASDNVTAQSLYARLAKRTGWVTYELDLLDPEAPARGGGPA